MLEDEATGELVPELVDPWEPEVEATEVEGNERVGDVCDLDAGDEGSPI